MRTVIASSLAALGAAALAHEGHGAPAVHWHATDLWGFVALALLVGAAIWWRSK